MRSTHFPKMLTSFFESLEARRMMAVDVVINPAQRFQQIDGFGTALTANVNSPYSTDAWRDMYYQDLGSSMLRMGLDIRALAGPDNNLATPVTMVEDIQTNIAQFNFAAQGVANYGGLVASSLAKKLDNFKLIASLWTPPHWMKGEEVNKFTGAPTGVQPVISGTDSVGGSIIDTPDNWTQFGRYVAAFVKGFEQTYGVPIYALSIQNELAFHEPYNSCVYTPALYVKAIKTVADAFDHYGITTKIQGPEEVGVGSTANLGILSRDFGYINAVRADPVAMADLDIYSIHGFATETATPNRSPEMWREYWNGRPAGTYPSPNWTGISGDGKTSWMTETSGQSNTWDSAFGIVSGAQDALTQGNVSAWMYWQTGNGKATADTASLTAGTDTTGPKYVAAKHFFRYIRPGAFRVSATPSDPVGVYVSAFVQDQQRTLTTVIVNESATDQTVNLSTLNTPVSSFNIARRSSATESWADIGPVNFANGIATVSLPAQSVITLQGITGPAVTDGSFSFDQSQKVRVSFNTNVAPSLSAGDLTVQNLTNPGATVTVSGVTYDPATNTATFAFNPPILPDGNYRVTIPAANVSDSGGATLASNYTFNFFALTGDANRDRRVDTIDFDILAANFGKAPAGFSEGNFNYDGTIDTIDFNLFYTRFSTHLAEVIG